MTKTSLIDLNQAYRNFFASAAGKRKGPKVGPPEFRSRKDRRQAVRFTANTRFRVLVSGRLRLSRVGDVAVRWSRELPAVPTSVTVIRDAAGRYFASFVVEAGGRPLSETGRECGIDLGLGHFAVLDDGTKVSAPRLLPRAEKKLKRAQRDLSRKQKGSNRREKARVKLARAHARVADARRDFHHKLSTKITRENQAVYVEDLAVAGLARTKLAKSVHDAGWSAFTKMLEYKAELYGRDFRRIGRWEPTVHDRDVNAAKNIAALGRREAQNACGGPVRPLETAAQTVETGSHRGVA